jgi:uncharacterized protein (DUF2147 family)
MKTRSLKTCSFPAAALASSLALSSLSPRSASAAASPIGEWKIADGSANVVIRSCGVNLCGYVSWSRDTGSMVGREVLIDMKPNGDIWSGMVINVVDGQKYSARISLQGEQTLKVEGCVLGGMICGGQKWSRVK